EMADLGRESLERRRRQSESGEELRVAVARDDLGRGELRLQPEPLAREAFGVGIHCRVRADGARQLPEPVRLQRGGNALPVALELERPAGELPPERDRLRVDAVR